jgi:hypothetical protein
MMPVSRPLSVFMSRDPRQGPCASHKRRPPSPATSVTRLRKGVNVASASPSSALSTHSPLTASRGVLGGEGERGGEAMHPAGGS